jgi:hypothetical protein
MDRASDFGSDGWGFESLQAHQFLGRTGSGFLAGRPEDHGHWDATAGVPQGTIQRVEREVRGATSHALRREASGTVICPFDETLAAKFIQNFGVIGGSTFLAATADARFWPTLLGYERPQPRTLLQVRG